MMAVVFVMRIRVKVLMVDARVEGVLRADARERKIKETDSLVDTV